MQETLHQEEFTVEKGGFKTKGDKNNRLDFGVVRKEDIFGKSIIVIPKVGHINLFLAGK